MFICKTLFLEAIFMYTPLGFSGFNIRYVCFLINSFDVPPSWAQIRRFANRGATASHKRRVAPILAFIEVTPVPQMPPHWDGECNLHCIAIGFVSSELQLQLKENHQNLTADNMFHTCRSLPRAYLSAAANSLGRHLDAAAAAASTAGEKWPWRLIRPADHHLLTGVMAVLISGLGKNWSAENNAKLKLARTTRTALWQGSHYRIFT